MIRPENIPRRQRWLEPQANLMNMGVSFPSSSVQEFYHYGGTGGFGTPFVAPFWGYASNFPSSSSSSSSHIKEPIVKKETPVIQKKIEKGKDEIYDEIAFSKDYDSDIKGKDKIYDEIAFSSELSQSKGNQSRLSRKELEFVANSKKAQNDKHLLQLIKEGNEAEEKGDYKTSAKKHREAQEKLSDGYGLDIRFIDPEAKKAYGYNSIEHHISSIVDEVIKRNLSIEDVFFYDEKAKLYFFKEKYGKEFQDEGFLLPTSKWLYSNYHSKKY
jgi:hypothetical protein